MTRALPYPAGAARFVGRGLNGRRPSNQERDVREMNEFTGWQFVRPTWRHAALIAEWAVDQQHLDVATSGAQPFAVTVVSSWWNHPSVQPLLLVDQSRVPVAYGEIWDNSDQDESELAHLLIDPGQDSALAYRSLVGGLIDRARADGRSRCVVRLPFESNGLIELSRRLGLIDVDPTIMAAWNHDQPRTYHWLERRDFRAAAAG